MLSTQYATHPLQVKTPRKHSEGRCMPSLPVLAGADVTYVNRNQGQAKLTADAIEHYPTNFTP